jgi:hypothetical protein
MSNTTASRSSFALASCLGLALAFLAGRALAEDDKLDEARQNTAKAIALLQTVQGDKAPRDKHRKKAIDLLTRAQGEILKAKGE